MIDDYDRNTNPRWPLADENPAARARRLARAYRDVAAETDPEATAAIDARATAWGETWVTHHEDTVDDDRELTTAEAAELVNVAPQTIRNWACLDHPERPGQKLLTRSGKRGRETLYLAVSVRNARAVLLRVQHERTGP